MKLKINTFMLFKSVLPVYNFTLFKRPFPLIFSPIDHNAQFKHDHNNVNKLFARKITLYKFDLINLLAGLSSMKQKVVVMASFGMPLNILLYNQDAISGVACSTLTISVTLILLKLYIASRLINGWIGFIYVYENSAKITIAYIDFNGNRVDRDFDLTDFVPLQDNRNKFRDRYYSVIKLRNSKEHLKIRFKQCHLIDEDEFERIFGSLPEGSL